MLQDTGQTSRTEVVQRSSQEPHGAGLAGERVETEVFTVTGGTGRLDLAQLWSKVVTVEAVVVRVERAGVLHQLLRQQPGQQPLARPGGGGGRARSPEEVENQSTCPHQHHQALQLDIPQSLLPALAEPQELQGEVPAEVDEVNAGGARVKVLEAVMVVGRAEDT